MSIYDLSGKKLSSELTSADVKRAFVSAVADGSVSLGSQIGATLSYGLQSSAQETNMKTAYDNLLAEYKKTPNTSIPFFITTDQHGRGLDPHRYVNNLDTDGMNLFSINLGDTVLDIFNHGSLDEAYGDTWQVKNFIGVPGNHDCHTKSEEVCMDFDIIHYFGTTNLKRKMMEGTADCYTVVDEARNVKFLIVDSYYSKGIYNSLPDGISTAIANWLIDELSKNDGYDPIILRHFPACATWRGRDAQEETANELLYNDGSTLAFWNLLLARKNKTVGTYTDVQGVVHDFDFSGCKEDLLCCLHGHNHAEAFTTNDGLTAYTADWHGNNRSCVFGLIDKIGKTLKIWKADGVAAYDVLVLPI